MWLYVSRYDAGGYWYGFNGKENDNEIKGEGNQQDYGMRVYDPRIGKFLSVDPLSPKYPELTPYQFASNTPIWAIDIDGLESGVISFNPGVNLSRAQTADNFQRGIRNWWSTPETSEYWRGVLRNDEDVLGYPRGTFTTKGDRITAALIIYMHNAQHEPGHLNLPSSTRTPRASNGPQAPKASIEVDVSQPAIKVPGSNSTEPINVAFGKTKSYGSEVYTNLSEFAESKGAINYRTFNKIPNYSEVEQDFINFEGSFLFATDAVKVTNGKVFFNLDGVDMNAVSKIKPGVGLYQQLDELGGQSWWEKSKITEWELRQVTSDKALLNNTHFYEGGKEVPAKSVLNRINQ
ncbi:RHS repeat domain-containing protein [Chitinophaga sp. sic0106]|uniref:RHS repeat domain-containing protein n=1 Tax=Chitinophaga sp. sic0106 TaxID=2854785 RepID=UPI001C481184|nr:RHS repeat-associated core domain-containing protein [Chitinophaga sp. sic0106]MBV7531768.1 hypothetical protein [Chitinophaga sp. sic0106]